MPDPSNEQKEPRMTEDKSKEMPERVWSCPRCGSGDGGACIELGCGGPTTQEPKPIPDRVTLASLLEDLRQPVPLVKHNLAWAALCVAVHDYADLHAQAVRERDEAVALLRAWHSPGPVSLGEAFKRTDAFLSRIQEV